MYTFLYHILHHFEVFIQETLITLLYKTLYSKIIEIKHEGIVQQVFNIQVVY